MPCLYNTPQPQTPPPHTSIRRSGQSGQSGSTVTGAMNGFGFGFGFVETRHALSLQQPTTTNNQQQQPTTNNHHHQTITMEKFRGKYRIPSARAPWWDYGRAGAYFITICCARRSPLFGQISGGTMSLSPVGHVALELWREIPHHARNVRLGAFVVMPNHVHGILILEQNSGGDDGSHPPQSDQLIPDRFQNQGRNTISSMIGGYKSAVTRQAHRLGVDGIWQPRFHDHIIRTDDEHQRIHDYITTNPERWHDDRFFTAETF